MENTFENKAKFFAQYWGQPVMFNANRGKEYAPVEGYPLDNILILKSSYIELKPLAEISDEDAIEVAKIVHNANKIQAPFETYNYQKTDCLEYLMYSCIIHYQVADYLRKHSYAIGYGDLTVQQLEEYGWIKLNDK